VTATIDQTSNCSTFRQRIAHQLMIHRISSIWQDQRQHLSEAKSNTAKTWDHSPQWHQTGLGGAHDKLGAGYEIGP